MNNEQEIETLCIECAKHPSVKKFVVEHSASNVRCGVCGRMDPALQVCSTDSFPQLANLVRALIRFYYDEWDYNPHWGGDLTPEEILTGENPIIQRATAPSRQADEERFEELVESLLSPPYPDVAKGVSVYAGFDEVGRNCASSLQRKHWELIEFERRLLRENYFEIEPALGSKLNDLASDVEAFVEWGDSYSRARIGVKAHFRRYPIGFRGEILHQPYSGPLISAPPPHLADSGRLNRPGVSYLYLASDPDTAAAEVRPHPGHLLSIAQFRATRQIKIADFSVDIAQFCMSESRLSEFQFIHSIDTLMSTPVIPEESRRHSLSQLIADVVRQLGFEGVRYRSAVSQGTNLCIFNPQLFEEISASAKVLRVNRLTYETAEAATLNVPTNDDDPIDL